MTCLLVEHVGLDELLCLTRLAFALYHEYLTIR